MFATADAQWDQDSQKKETKMPDVIEKGKTITRTFVIEKTEGSDTVVVSSGNPDRMGDVIRQDGWVLDNFIKNPQMFYGHDSYKRLPIGNWKNVAYKDGRLSMDPVFADDIEGHTDAEIVKALWDKGFLKTVSVGFIPIEWKENEGGYEFLKQELLEVSIVPIPANTDAHRLEFKELMDQLDTLRKQVEQLSQGPTPKAKAGGEEVPPEPQVKRYHITLSKE
jgi:HK97 family phage prohead protease